MLTEKCSIFKDFQHKNMYMIVVWVKNEWRKFQRQSNLFAYQFPSLHPTNKRFWLNLHSTLAAKWIESSIWIGGTCVYALESVGFERFSIILFLLLSLCLKPLRLILQKAHHSSCNLMAFSCFVAAKQSHII